MVADPKLLHVATIGAPFGVRGCLRLKTRTESPLDAITFGKLRDSHGKEYEFSIVRIENNNTLIVQEPLVPDRTVAEQLRGLRLYIPAEAFPTVEDPDAFYYSELEGMSVVNTQNEPLGVVHSVENYGASDILVVKTAHGFQQIAFIKDSVLDIQRQERIILVEETHLI